MKSVSYTTSILIQYKNRYKLIWNSKKYRVNKRILNYKERVKVNFPPNGENIISPADSNEQGTGLKAQGTNKVKIPLWEEFYYNPGIASIFYGRDTVLPLLN